MTSARIPQSPVAKEYGSWAVLLVPILVSASVVGTWTHGFIFLLISSIAIFMSHVPANVLFRHFAGFPQNEGKLYQAKFWTLVYLLVGTLFALPLLLEGYVLLLAIGALGVVALIGNFFLTRFFSRTIAGDLTAVAGLTLGAPAGHYVLTGAVDKTAFLLYAFNLLFFGCSVFYVHMKIRASARKSDMTWSDKLSLGKLNLLYHAAVVFVVAIFAAVQLTPLVVLVAFVPMIIHGVYGTVTLSRRVRFKNLGFLLLVQSILFGILVQQIIWR